MIDVLGFFSFQVKMEKSLCLLVQRVQVCRWLFVLLSLKNTTVPLSERMFSFRTAGGSVGSLLRVTSAALVNLYS